MASPAMAKVAPQNCNSGALEAPIWPSPRRIYGKQPSTLWSPWAKRTVRGALLVTTVPAM
jgi:hypothetical protein